MAKPKKPQSKAEDKVKKTKKSVKETAAAVAAEEDIVIDKVEVSGSMDLSDEDISEILDGGMDDLPPDDDADMPPDDFDDEKLVAEVQKAENAGEEGDGDELADGDDLPPPEPLPVNVAVEDDVDVLPSMEGISILREKELNDVLNDVKRRSEANGGYITYEELNQILPQNIVDEIQSERYLKILEALGVQVLHEDAVKRWLESKAEKLTDAKARAQEMIEDPIRMYPPDGPGAASYEGRGDFDLPDDRERGG